MLQEHNTGEYRITYHHKLNLDHNTKIKEKNEKFFFTFQEWKVKKHYFEKKILVWIFFYKYYRLRLQLIGLHGNFLVNNKTKLKWQNKFYQHHL